MPRFIDKFLSAVSSAKSYKLGKSSSYKKKSKKGAGYITGSSTKSKTDSKPSKGKPKGKGK